MRPYILAESNWKILKDQKVDLVVLPWGATEAHNYHLPYGTDNILAKNIASEGARLAFEQGANIIVLPEIPFGINTGQTDIKLDINMNPSTQALILKDVIEVLNRQGIHKLLLFNSHGGNDFKNMIRELGVQYPNIFLSSCFWAQALDKSKYFDHPDGDHADEMETSLLLYLKPEWVLPLKEAGEGGSKHFRIKAFQESWAWAEREWSKVTMDTGIGNPKKATAEKGKIYFKDITKKVSQLFVELSAADLDNLYQ